MQRWRTRENNKIKKRNVGKTDMEEYIKENIPSNGGKKECKKKKTHRAKVGRVKKERIYNILVNPRGGNWKFRMPFRKANNQRLAEKLLLGLEGENRKII